MRLFFLGKEITPLIRSSEVERFVPLVAQRPRVREALTELQRKHAKNGSVVVEGRDAGTVVFPAADVKFFLTAGIRARAQRKFLELRRNNVSKPLDECIREIELRDKLDKNRTISPLEPATDAVVIDTSNCSVAEALEKILNHLSEKHIFARTVTSALNVPPLLIAVAGLIGVGKSTLCQWLSEELAMPLFAENPDDNPYIGSYYSEPQRWALHSQMWFLYRKYELLSSIADQKSPAIIDRTLHEDYIFAKVLLDSDALTLYEHWYRLVFSLSPQPSLIISLEASVPELLSRIANRGRDYERIDSVEFRALLETLHREYSYWISEYSEAPVIRVDTGKTKTLDPSFRPWLVDRVKTVLAGVEVDV